MLALVQETRRQWINLRQDRYRYAATRQRRIQVQFIRYIFLPVHNIRLTKEKADIEDNVVRRNSRWTHGACRWCWIGRIRWFFFDSDRRWCWFIQRARRSFLVSFPFHSTILKPTTDTQIPSSSVRRALTYQILICVSLSISAVATSKRCKGNEERAWQSAVSINGLDVLLWVWINICSREIVFQVLIIAVMWMPFVDGAISHSTIMLNLDSERILRR